MQAVLALGAASPACAAEQQQGSSRSLQRELATAQAHELAARFDPAMAQRASRLGEVFQSLLASGGRMAIS